MITNKFTKNFILFTCPEYFVISTK